MRGEVKCGSGSGRLVVYRMVVLREAGRTQQTFTPLRSAYWAREVLMRSGINKRMLK